MSFDSEEIRLAWCAGILEGEGCFSSYVRKSNAVTGVSILCEMTDEDTILRLKDFLGYGKVCYRENDRRSDGCIRKPTWIFSIQRQEEVYLTLLKLAPFMSKRRSLKIQEQLEILRGKTFYGKYRSIAD